MADHRAKGPLRACSLALIAALGAVACSAAPAKKKTLGALPSAVTSARPEWLPPRVTAGLEVAPDARETHLFDLRRLSQGWAVSEIAWLPDGQRLIALAARAGEAVRTLSLLPTAQGAATRLSPEGVDVLGFALLGGGERPRLLYATAAGLFESDLQGGARASGAESRAVLGLSAGPEGRLFALERDGAAVRFAERDEHLARKPPLLDDLSAVVPAFSPDRAYVAYARRASGAPADVLSFASVEGRGGGELAAIGQLERIAFHPSGRLLVVGADRDRASFELYGVFFPGTLASTRASDPGVVVRRLTFSQGRSPAFSADGRSLAFASTRGGASADLYVARFLEDP